MTGLSIGIDIGGTKIAAGRVGRAGLLGNAQVVPTGASAGPSAVLDRAITLARWIASQAVGEGPSSIGIASGGWIDQASGRVVGATSLLPGWEGVDLVEVFEREFGLPVGAINDVQAMAVAEARLGAGQAAPNCLYVAVGTGIGGAITIDGRLIRGRRGFAGAIGHIPWGLDGPVCSCGRRGCIEPTASGPGIARSFAECLRGLPDLVSTNPSGQPIGLPDVAAALQSSSGRQRTCALDAISTGAQRLGRVLGGLANTLDPDRIVVGGGAAAALGDAFLVALRSAVEESTLPGITLEVVRADLGPSASVVGAGLVALDALGSHWELRRASQ